MIYEGRFEALTKGLVIGAPTLIALSPLIVPIRKDRVGRFAAGDAIAVNPADFGKTFKIVIASREGGEILWQRPFATRAEALVVWQRLIGVDVERISQRGPYRWPTTWIDGELAYYFATVATYTSSNSTNADWGNNTGNRCPAGVTSVDYLVVAGGGPGGFDGGVWGGGGGGAGQHRTGSLSVTPSTQYTITVGSGGLAAVGNGSNSVFSSITSTGGGMGGNANSSGGTQGGSGGGGSGSPSTTYGGGAANGTGTNAGGAGAFAPGEGDPGAGGGGGGAGAAGTDASGGTAGNGGNGASSSITGSAVTRAGGGAPTGGSAGTGGGGTTGAAGTANTGGGGGQSASGGSGVVILSFTEPPFFGQAVM